KLAIRMSRGAVLSSEDVSWHKNGCLYRRFMEQDRQTCLQTDDEIRRQLTLKYKKEALVLRTALKKKNRKTSTRRSHNVVGLTPHEEALVKQKVEEQLSPNGIIRWYLDSQRKEFEDTKQRFYQQCNCVKVTGNIVEESLPKPEVESITVTPEVDAMLVSKKENASVTEDDDEDDAWSVRF
ncbi:hypothetical protein Ocin01_08177, partial [Orchesella cincta]